MLVWSSEFDEEQVLLLPDARVEIDFFGTEALSSLDFKKIFILCRQFKKNGRVLAFKTSPQLKAILQELGLDKLGVEFL